MEWSRGQWHWHRIDSCRDIKEWYLSNNESGSARQDSMHEPISATYGSIELELSGRNISVCRAI